MILFAYAGNMDVDKFAKTVPSAKRIGIGKLPVYNFVFNTTSSDESSKANVAKSDIADSAVWGVLIEIDDSERTNFYYPEGGLRLESVTCLDEQGNICNAEVFSALPHATNTHLLPYDWYLRRILRLAKEAGLPDDYISQIASMPCKPDPDEKRRTERMKRG